MKKLVLFVITASLFGVNFVQAQPELPTWEVGVGMVGFYYPDYLGSNEQRLMAAPFPFVAYRSKKLEINRNEAKSILFEHQAWELDLSFSGSVPVNSNGNKLRNGMPDLDAALEIGPVLKYTLWTDHYDEVKFEWPIRAVIASDFKRIHHEGWVVAPGIYYYGRHSFSKNHRLKLTLGAGFRWGDERYHGYIYDVAPDYSRIGRLSYKTSAGYGGEFINLALDWYFERFWLGAFYRSYHLDRAAFKDSPLVERNHSHTMGIAATWRLWRSSTTIKTLD